jgi:hypothetical protein
MVDNTKDLLTAKISANEPLTRTDVENAFRLGEESRSDKNYAEAQMFYTAAAETGHLNSIYKIIGMIVNKLQGGEAERETVLAEIRVWAETAAKNGGTEDIYNQGHMFREKELTDIADIFFETAADAGHTDAAAFTSKSTSSVADKTLLRRGKIVVTAVSALAFSNALYQFIYMTSLVRLFHFVTFVILAATVVLIMAYYYGTFWSKVAIIIASCYMFANSFIDFLRTVFGEYASLFDRAYTIAQLALYIAVVYTILLSPSAKAFIKKQSEYFDIR